MAGIAHPALSFIPADNYLLAALLLNATLLAQWSRVQRRLRQLPVRTYGPLSAAEVPNPSWLEPFSREQAIRTMRSINAAQRSYRSARRALRSVAKHSPPEKRSIALESVGPIVRREQVLL